MAGRVILGMIAAVTVGMALITLEFALILIGYALGVK